MVIIAVDDEKLALEGMVHEIQKVVPEGEVYGFRSAAAAREFLESHSCDVAFLDIQMRGMNGMEFAKNLKVQYPKLNIIFATGYDEYAGDAFRLHASGYIMKPVTAEKIAREMEELRHPVEEKKIGVPILRVQTFGNFEVYVNEEPLKFARSKSKELFAYLVHKAGSSCNAQELIAILFESRTYSVSLQRQFQTIMSAMMKALKEAGVSDCIIRQHNQTCVDTAKIDCDYYRFLQGDPVAINAYTGEYMANYSWAEFVMGYLDQKL